ncbi:DUF3667 domain-containing protein [Roseivirga sp. BDSF3-8]|uniref:DUF3667 domain-containing protein n=1 Tax=Roseivirga sp. BDSF3-8 TaxID=3241598 RepID=UPI003531AF00
MKRRRKTSHCLNCGLDLDRSTNFCPRCGQENTDNNVSFSTLARDFISNYFSLDGRFGRSVLPFLFNPGKLTREFISGRRKTYMHPVRLYLVLSLIFFTVVAFYAQSQVDGDFKALDANYAEPAEGELSYSVDGEDGTKKRRLQLKDKNDSLLMAEELVLPANVENQLARLDSLMYRDTVASIDSVADSTKRKSRTFVLNGQETGLDVILELMNNKNLTEAEILDSAGAKQGTTEYWLGKQAIRLNRAEGKQVLAAIMKNLPIMMFILMPVFALMLKVLYMRRDNLYIHHLVHAIHIHSFLYLALLLIVVVIWTSFLKQLLVPLLIIALLAYLFMSFYKVYRQGILKTFFKLGFLAFAYTTLLSFALLMETLISLALY